MQNFFNFKAAGICNNYSALNVQARWQWSRGLRHKLSSNAGLIGSNSTEGMDVGVRLFCIVLSCVYVAALRRAHHSSEESYRLWKMIAELNKRPGPWIGWKSRWKNKGSGPHRTHPIVFVLHVLNSTHNTLLN
jgi:hypothetical protein